MTMNVEALDKAGYRKFGLTMAIVIALIFGLFLPWVFSLKIPDWPWFISATLFVWSLIAPQSLVVIYKPWMIFGHYIGLFNTRIILTLVFFTVFFPVSLLLKVLGKDAMNRNFKQQANQSYWKQSTRQAKEHMEKVY